jgi:hypothetical protein
MERMGRCHEFGSQIREGCGHPMRAGERACACPECGVVCQGLFDGCPDVWARGPRPVALTNVAALGGNGVTVRALNAGTPQAPPGAQPGPTINAGQAGPPPPASAPPPPPPPPTNGFYTSAPPPPPLRQSGEARTEVLQWFEDAFDELRNELHAVVSTVTRQQAMLAELLDSREAELRVVLVAESLPELAGEAAAKALANESGGLADMVAGYLDDFRTAVDAQERSNASVMDHMRELLQRIEATAEWQAEDARTEGDDRLEALKASVARQLRPVAADVAALAAEVEAVQEREAARTRALKASLTKQLQPLAAKLDAAVDRSDHQLAEIRTRLDAMAGESAGVPAPRVVTRRRPATTPRG